MVSLGPAAPALTHLGGDRAADHVAAGEVFGVGRIALHETLAVLVDQVTALAAGALGNQHALAGDAGGMELEKFHILQRHPDAQGHGHAVTGIDVSVSGGAEQLAATAAGDQGGLGLDQQGLTGFDLHDQGPEHLALIIADQIDGEVFVEEVGLGTDVLLIQGVQYGVAGAVGRCAGAGRLVATEILALSAEGALVDAAVVQTRKGHAEVFQFVHGLRSNPAHVLDGILVAQVIAALDRVVHVPMPVVVEHIGQGRIDPALGRHRVRTRGKNLGYHRYPGIRPGKLQGSPKAGPSGAHDQRVETSSGQCHATTSSLGMPPGTLRPAQGLCG